MTLDSTLIGALLVAHGIGHLLGVMPVLGVRGRGWNARSWLLTPPLGASGAAAVSVVLWGLGFAGFIWLGVAVLGWVPLPPRAIEVAVGLALLSTLTLVLFWNAFPTLVPNKVGALAVNGAVLWAVWVEGWTAADLVGG